MQRFMFVGPPILLLVFPAIGLGQLASDVNKDGCVDLHDFADVQNTFTGPDCDPPVIDMEMVLVPGGGAGPEYDFLIGKYEVTNAQLAVFLNDIDRHKDGGLTFVRIDGVGAVYLLDDTPIYAPDLFDYSQMLAPILYADDRTPGDRYSLIEEFALHPARGVSWFGALMFCNWLTLNREIPGVERCYVEGWHRSFWRPRTVEADDWLTRDATDQERQGLLQFNGFRLPMDHSGHPRSDVGCFLRDGPYNEWFKAASYDPLAPSLQRSSISECQGIPFHWVYGCKSDSPWYRANFGGSPYGSTIGTTPVGYFNGHNLWKYAPNGIVLDGANHYGLYDMSGNVAEWGQSRSDSGGVFTQRIFGGGWLFLLSGGSTRYQLLGRPDLVRSDIGFRVVRVP